MRTSTNEVAGRSTLYANFAHHLIECFDVTASSQVTAEAASRLTDAPQFSLRSLLIVLGTCAIAFATVSAGLHAYLTVAAAMVVVFWVGAALCFMGLVLDAEGDSWLVPAVLAETTGAITSVIAVFTATYYGGMFFLYEIPRTLLS